MYDPVGVACVAGLLQFWVIPGCGFKPAPRALQNNQKERLRQRSKLSFLLFYLLGIMR